MATRKAGGTVILGDIEDVTEVNEWAIIDSNATSVLWEKPTTGERIKLPVGAKPTPRIIEIATLNGAILSPEDHGHPDMDPDDLIDVEPASPLDRVVTMLQSGTDGGRAEVKIYRMRDGEKDTYCGSFTPEQFEQGNLELIRSNWGGGKFRIKVYAITPPSNKFVVRLNEVVEIEASALPPNGVAGANDPFNSVLRRLDEMEKRAANPQSGVNSMREMLQMFVMMKQAFGGDNNQKSSVAEIVQAVKDLKELSSDLNPAPGNDIAGMGMEVLKMIGSQQANPAPPVHQHQPIQPIQVQPNPIPPLQPEQVDPQFSNHQYDEGDEMNSFVVKLMLKAIVKKAGENADVGPIAVDLAAKAPDSVLDMLESELWWEMLSEFEPAVIPHQPWFSSLRTAILEEIAKYPPEE